MEKILIFIKHHLGSIWSIVEWGNGIVFSLLYKKKMDSSTSTVIKEYGTPPYLYRRLEEHDATSLYELIRSQDPSDLVYFNPHGFDSGAICRQFKNRSFLMMGAFDGEKLAGYFFLRFFANKKCFVGRLIDKRYRGKGMGLVMNDIMYEIAWKMGFRCLSTISKNNKLVMNAHAKNRSMVVIKELQNNYLLVEFVKQEQID